MLSVHSPVSALEPPRVGVRRITRLPDRAGVIRPGTAWLALSVVVLTLTTAAVPAESGDWVVSRSSGEPQVAEEQVTEGERTIQRFRCRGPGSASFVELSCAAPMSLLHDEFRATLRVRSNVPGILFGIRIVLPDQIDPRTGRPLETILRGSTTRTGDDWQTVEVSGSRSQLQSHLRRVRVELHRSDVVARSAVATGLALLVELSPGETVVDLDDFDYGPVIAPREETLRAVESSVASSEPAVRQFVPLDVELNRIMLGDRPVILRFAPDHGESPDALQRLGLNAAWIQDFRAAERAERLRNLGLAVLATPPHPEFEPGDFERLLRSLPPLDQLCPSASAWYTGTRVPPSQLEHLLALSREVRSADRRLQRPLMADIIGAEGAASREIDLIGIGRHVVGRTESFGELRNELFQRRRLAGQLAFPWTWIQTEPSGTQQRYRQPGGGQLPVVEPEQILLQMHAAISAGCKGVGFWKTHPLDPDDPADREVLLTIELANLQLAILEPFLAEGRVDGHLPILASGRSRRDTSADGDASAPLQSALNGRATSVPTSGGERPAGPDAAVIVSGPTLLLLLTCWDEESQYVPTPMFRREARLVVAASETASAWRVSASGIVGLPRDVTAGGLAINVRDLDQHAVVVVSSDPELIRSLDRRIQQSAQRTAALSYELSRLKLNRVTSTLGLIERHVSLPVSSADLVSRAEQAVRRAERDLQARSFRDCIGNTELAMRLIRECQYLCWRQATDPLDGPTASPHTISFATLPDHWAMMERLRERRPRESDNLIPSGSFENQRQLVDGVWNRDPSELPGWVTAADVIRTPNGDNSVLRLAASTTSDAARSAERRRGEVTPLVVRSPEISTRAGDILRITGRMRLGRTIAPGSERPVLLFDSELGPEHALRPDFLSAVGRLDADARATGNRRLAVRDPFERNWVDFEFFREARTDGPFQVSVALTAAVELQLDDIRVTRLPGPLPGTPSSVVRTASESR